MKCLKCKDELSAETKFCPHCGEKVTAAKTNDNNLSKDSSDNRSHKLIRKNADYCINIICFDEYGGI